MMNILEARLLANVNEVSISDVISTEADSRTGYMARFAPVSVGTVKDYSGKVEWDAAAVTPVELTLNQKKYFAFGVDDVEELKTNPKRIDKAAKTQARDISRAEDEFLLDLLAKGAGKSISRTVNKPEQAYDALVDANKELNKLDAPFTDRFLVINNDFLGQLEKDARFTKYDDILANGILEGTNINGAKILVTETLPADTVLAVQKDGVGFERFIDKIETMRLETAFADGVRGMSVFDGVALDKNCIVKVAVKSTEVEG